MAITQLVAMRSLALSSSSLGQRVSHWLSLRLISISIGFLGPRMPAARGFPVESRGQIPGNDSARKTCNIIAAVPLALPPKYGDNSWKAPHESFMPVASARKPYATRLCSHPKKGPPCAPLRP